MTQRDKIMDFYWLDYIECNSLSGLPIAEAGFWRWYWGVYSKADPRLATLARSNALAGYKENA